MYLIYQSSIEFARKRIFIFGRTIGPKICRLAGVLALTFSIAACSISSRSDALMDEDSLVTGSVSQSAQPHGVNGGDAEVIKAIVADSGDVRPKTSELAWSNPDTGNSGTIVAIDKFIGSHGQSCKKFQTTVDSFVGISLYDGETCEVKSGMWVLSWFMRR